MSQKSKPKSPPRFRNRFFTNTFRKAGFVYLGEDQHGSPYWRHYHRDLGGVSLTWRGRQVWHLTHYRTGYPVVSVAFSTTEELWAYYVSLLLEHGQ